MKYSLHYILLLPLLLLASCSEDNWFIHTVKYNDKVDNPEMVVTATLEVGRTPVVYVNESVFFLDPQHDATDTIWDGYYDGYYYTRHVRTGFLRDAEVLMSVNGADPIHLIGAERMDTLENMRYSWYNGVTENKTRRKQFAYTSDYVLQPGDKVELTVTHPRYKQPARVSQQMPAPVQFTIESVSMDSVEKYAALFNLSVRLAPYEGNPSDLLCFRAISYSRQLIKDSYYDYTTQTQRDTVYAYLDVDNLIYSQDLSFVGYDKTNKQLSSGYYGASQVGLFRASNTQEEVLPLRVYCAYQDYCDNVVDSIVLEARAVSRDYYLYCASMFAAGNWSQNIPDFFGGSSGNAFIEDIEDIFNEMGSMEGVQLYSNVENAIGHVTSLSSSSITIVPDSALYK